MEPTDFLGVPIKPGNRVAYPMRRGSRMWLTTMRIEGIEEVSGKFILFGFGPSGRRTRTKNTQNCVVI